MSKHDRNIERGLADQGLRQTQKVDIFANPVDPRVLASRSLCYSLYHYSTERHKELPVETLLTWPHAPFEESSCWVASETLSFYLDLWRAEPCCTAGLEKVVAEAGRISPGRRPYLAVSPCIGLQAIFDMQENNSDWRTWICCARNHRECKLMKLETPIHVSC
jgi:hypothetical protein